MSLDKLNNSINILPNSTGVYQFLDVNGSIIYIGKAKNLKKRVKSYFNKDLRDGKTRSLVKKISSIKHIVVKSETDALLLENNLIKKNKPKYNILLKDDKSFPWICIKNEKFPRVFFTRKLVKDGSEYFGPYTNIKSVKTLLDIIKTLYPIRISNYNFTEKKTNSSLKDICLKIHKTNEHIFIEGFDYLENCDVDNIITEREYNENISHIKEILRGKFNNIKTSLKKQMHIDSNLLDFEKAQYSKQKIEVLEKYQSKSVVVSSNINNIDVFSIVKDDKYAYVNFLQVSRGSIVRSYNLEIKIKLEEGLKKILELAVIEIRTKFYSKSSEVFVPIYIDLGEKINVVVPKIGDKKKILELSFKNVKHFRFDRIKQLNIIDPDRHYNRILDRLKLDLNLSLKPVHIECFDNSNIQGSNPTSACVVFKNGKPSKKDYRHFNIKNVVGPDDYASMKEVVYRRYKRLLKEKKPLPQLIIIDGGKGQLSSSYKSLLDLKLDGKIQIIGIAKRLEEIFFPNDSVPLYLDKKSESLKLIQQLRNEAHRFSLKHHRNKRSKNAFINELNLIKGIGENSVIDLLKYFKSNNNIAKAKLKDIESVIGKSKALLVYNYYNDLNIN